jgi:hypothetical protein
MDNAEFRKRVKTAIAREQITQGCLARLTGIEEHRLCKILNGTLVLSAETVRRLTVGVQFVEYLSARMAPVPVCYHNFERIEPVWNEFLRTAHVPQPRTRAAVQA